MSKFEYIVPESDAGRQIKDIIRNEFTFSRKLRTNLKKDRSLILLNGALTQGWHSVKPGDIITVDFPDETSHFEPENIPISVIYEDDDLLIINKQPGYVCHPTKGHPCHTMANGIQKYIVDSGQSFKIRFINRLDMDTSGLLAIAKNSHSQDNITKQMAAGNVLKKYVAVVKGIIEDDTGVISAPIGRPDPERVERGVIEGGHDSTTHFTVLRRFEKGFTMVELILETGRTHQIRVHLSHSGHPVVGDHLYGGENPLLIERQALHAFYLGFYHPVTGERMEFSAPIPEDILKLIEKIS